MDIFKFKLPDIGEGIAEAELVAWHVEPGDWVEEDAPLADLMTDKATVEMSSPVTGRLIEVAGAIGDQIAIGSVLATFEVDDAAVAISGPAELHPAVPAPAAPPEIGHLAGEEVGGAAIPPADNKRDAFPSARDAPARRILASPTVRQRARVLNIDLAALRSAGDGRIRHADLDAYLTYNAHLGYGGAVRPRPDETVRVIGLRRQIAKNMAASKRNIPHFSYIEELDVTKLEALRADLNATRGAKAKLTMLPLLISAICKVVPDFPMMNARFDDETDVVTRFGTVHLGLATQTVNGLMVPVIRDAQDRNIWQLADEIGRLADSARSGKALPQELSGSTLTLTSLGPWGGIATTPVINRPEVAIIGPNKVVERPVVRDGAIVIAKLMNISISCDHRVVDGWDAAQFVQALKRLVETPALLFVP